MLKIEYEDFVNKAKSLYHGGMLRYETIVEEEIMSSLIPFDIAESMQKILDDAQVRFEEEMGWYSE